VWLSIDCYQHVVFDRVNDDDWTIRFAFCPTSLHAGLLMYMRSTTTSAFVAILIDDVVQVNNGDCE
jgi:hypothetical protein